MYPPKGVTCSACQVCFWWFEGLMFAYGPYLYIYICIEYDEEV